MIDHLCRIPAPSHKEHERAAFIRDWCLDQGLSQVTIDDAQNVIIFPQGGHSFGNFGNRNAIHALSVFITGLYAIKPPTLENSRTTYNVGGIWGGTSVNTIAQQAGMLYKYRSDHPEGLTWMEKAFYAQAEALRATGVGVDIKRLGDRPSMGEVDPTAQAELEAICLASVEEVTGMRIPLHSGSTDINLPLSLGIPALCFGAYRGAGAHTREEWIDTASLSGGLTIWKSVVDKLIALGLSQQL